MRFCQSFFIKYSRFPAILEYKVKTAYTIFFSKSLENTKTALLTNILIYNNINKCPYTIHNYEGFAKKFKIHFSHFFFYVVYVVFALYSRISLKYSKAALKAYPFIEVKTYFHIKKVKSI